MDKRSRPYQTAAKRAALTRLMTRGKPQLLSIATGGGKTFIANNVLAEFVERRGGWVLWLAKSWELLAQAERDLAERHPGLARRTGREGGEHTAFASRVPGRRRATVVYSTLQTFHRRAEEITARRGRPTLVVWDEAHWGVTAKMGRRLLRYCRQGSTALLGLTATPRRSGAGLFEVAYAKSFVDLVKEGYLAQPLLATPIRTGTRWRPDRSNEHSDFTASSLDKLGRNDRRNAFITQHYVAKEREYGKTLIFACNIEHANRIVHLLDDRGVPARSVHSHQDTADNERALAQFRRGAVRVLVSVEQLTHGVDVPDTQTVFLCRPTASDILFMQMVGRAARRDPKSGKASFHVVEFTDNLQRHGDALVTGRSLFEGSGGTSGQALGQRARPAVERRVGHRYDPDGAPTWLDSDLYPDALRGLWFRVGQTFGIEFELTAETVPAGYPDALWWRRAQGLRLHLVGALGSSRVAASCGGRPPTGEDPSTVWTVKWDATCGWEVCSPILANEEGFQEVVSACGALDAAAKEHGLRVNWRTGTHIHLGWAGASLVEVKRAIYLTRAFEPALATLVSPSRVVRFCDGRYDMNQPNQYCRPIGTVFEVEPVRVVGSLGELLAMCEDPGDRYLTFNIKPLKTIGTVEVRMHNGTLDAGKILLWLSLWSQILWAASRPQTFDYGVARDVCEPSEDIFGLVREYLPEAQPPGFLRRIAQRRREVIGLWRRRPELAGWVRVGERWGDAGATALAA